jgi:hypothetical protein
MVESIHLGSIPQLDMGAQILLGLFILQFNGAIHWVVGNVSLYNEALGFNALFFEW